MKPWFAAVCLVASLLPAGETRPLFTIERSLNHNVLHYEANLAADGTMDPKEPIVAYWVMLEKGGAREDLPGKSQGLRIHRRPGGRGEGVQPPLESAAGPPRPGETGGRDRVGRNGDRSASLPPRPHLHRQRGEETHPQGPLHRSVRHRPQNGRAVPRDPAGGVKLSCEFIVSSFELKPQVASLAC